MKKPMPSSTRGRQSGVMLLEALVAILIFSIGVFSIVAMQAVAIKTVTQSKVRADAAFLAGRIVSQIWTDAGNVGSYAYPGSGTPPSRLTNWVAAVNSRLPNSGTVPPIITITNQTAVGATVTVVVRWQLPEEQSLGLPPNNYTVVASIYRDS